MDEAFKARVDAFVKEYGELTQKHQIDFVQVPVYIPDPNGHWTTIIQNQPMDNTNRPIESPFIKENV